MDEIIIDGKVTCPRLNNSFFHPYVCQVCKWLSSGYTHLCDCDMVSYCSERHKEMDQAGIDGSSGHQEICKAMKELIDEKKMRRFVKRELKSLKYPDKYRTLKDQWCEHRLRYLKITREKLSRALQPLERQILMFTRSCVICRVETKTLVPCRNCYCAYYCKKDKGKIYSHKCQKLKEWLYTEIQTIDVNPIPKWRTFHDFPDKGDVDDMELFYDLYMLPTTDSYWEIPDFVYSDYVSGPITVYYNLCDAGLLEQRYSPPGNYVIHIIETSSVDVMNLPSWELFLHLLHDRTKLTIVMVGAELAPELENKRGKLQLCLEKCENTGHQLHFEYHRMLYHEYASSEFYTTPDLLVGFHVKLSGGETWKKLIFSLKTPDFPLILTARSRVNGLRYIKRIQTALCKRAIPSLNRYNPFRGFRPYRDYMNESIYYRNQQVIVYPNLRHITKSVTQRRRKKKRIIRILLKKEL